MFNFRAKKMPKELDPEEEAEIRGGRNLTLLGFGAIVIAIVTTSLSLIIYHNTGDIYLDRSRPGFLPDITEKKANGNYTNLRYSFPDTGEVNEDALEEYLERISENIEEIEELKDAFPEDSLSDTSLGIGSDDIRDIEKRT